jgi:hypothetical protein
MRTIRARAVAVFIALAGSILLTTFITSGSAVAFFSGGLFLDVQVESPATLVARGAAVDVPLEITCNATGSVTVYVQVTQRSGSGIAEGSGYTGVGCTGSGQRVVVRVSAFGGGKSFKQGTAVADAEVFGCRPNICGSETDTEVITINR